MLAFSNARAVEVSRGEEVLAFDPNAITELSMKTDKLRLVAHRGKPGQAFLIAVFTPSGLETCTGGDGFALVLTALRSLRVQRNLSVEETRRLQEGNLHSIRISLVANDDIAIDEWTFFLPEAKDGPVIGQSERMDVATELSLERQPFMLLEKGCRGLGAVRRKP